MSAQPKPRYTLEEYLELDRQSEARLEYWDGEIFDMSGVSKRHARIEINITMHLGPRLARRGCFLFPANMRLKVPSLPPYRYGDLSALRRQEQYEIIGGLDVLTNPALIIEVLSHSTEGFDRGEKFLHYKSIPSFCEYLLIAQHHPHVSHFVRQDDGSWIQRDYSDLEAAVRLASLGCELSLGEIYENVTFDESAIHPHLRPLA
jgi:Uma2 family endonuclease